MLQEATKPGPDTADFHVCENGGLKWVDTRRSLFLHCLVVFLRFHPGEVCNTCRQVPAWWRLGYGEGCLWDLPQLIREKGTNPKATSSAQSTISSQKPTLFLPGSQSTN